MINRAWWIAPVVLVLMLQLSGCDCDCGDHKHYISGPEWCGRHPASISCGPTYYTIGATLTEIPPFPSSLAELGINPNQTMYKYADFLGGASLEGEGFSAQGTWTEFPDGTGAHFDLSGAVADPFFNIAVHITFDEYYSGPNAGTMQNVKTSFQASVDNTPTNVSMSHITDVPGAMPSACYAQAEAADPINLNSGEFTDDPQPDLVVGQFIRFRRHYGSLLKANSIKGAMGDNWMNNFETRLAVFGSRATVILFGGATMLFNKSGNSWTLDKPQPLAYQLIQNGANYQFLDAGAGIIYTFNSGGSLIRMEDRNANALTITPSSAGPTQITDGLGNTLTLTYSSTGNLTSVKDQTGRTVQYGFNGSLQTSFTDASGKVTSYSYASLAGPPSRPGLLTSIKRPLGNTVLNQTYDTLGRAMRQADALGNAGTFVFDTPAPGTGTFTDPLGDKTQAVHPDRKILTQAVDPNGKATSYVFDAANHPTQITDRLGNKTLIAYDSASGLPATVTDRRGAVTTNSYTSQTQGGFTFYLISKRTFADGTAQSYGYDATGNEIRFVDRAGKVTTSTFDKRGHLLTRTNPLGGVTTHTYNDDGTEASVTTPAGNMTTYAYDALQRRIKTTQPDGSVQTSTYDALDRVVQSANGAAPPQVTVFDDNGNLKSQSGGNGAGTTYGYDADDRRDSTTTPAGTRTETLDAVGRTVTVTDEAGRKTSASFDAGGRTLAVLDGNGNGNHYAWNVQNFPQSITDALSHTTSVTTDPLGRFLTLTTPLGLKWSASPDKLGRPVSFTSPLGHVTSFGLNQRGELIQQTLPGNIMASYTRDDLGDITAITDPNGAIWMHTFDNMGRETGFTDPLSQTSTVQFDSRNRPNQIKTPGGTVMLTHDGTGNLTRAQFSDGTDLNYQFTGGDLAAADNLSLSWNPLHQIVNSNGIAVIRNAVGQITNTTYGPGLTIAYKYNNVGDLIEIDDWLGGVTTFRVDAAHHLVSVTRPNGVVTSWTLDADNRLINKSVTTADATYSFSLKLDGEGNILSSDRTLPQLPQPAGGFNGYSFDAANQVSGDTYDSSGRLQSDGFRSYNWTMASRLTGYSGNDGAAQFAYDGLGLLVSRTDANGETDYVWNYAHPLPALAVVRSGGADIRYYVYLPSGALLYSIEAADNSRHYFHFDEEGSAAFLTDDNGSVSDTYGITPFGESVTHTGQTDNFFTFHGAFGVMQEGTTGLYYMRARWYDSVSQRFLSRDPSQSLDPLQIDPYQFALNNQLAFADPTGAIGRPQSRGGRIGDGRGFASFRSIRSGLFPRLDLASESVTAAPEKAPTNHLTDTQLQAAAILYVLICPDASFEQFVQSLDWSSAGDGSPQQERPGSLDLNRLQPDAIPLEGDLNQGSTLPAGSSLEIM